VSAVEALGPVLIIGTGLIGASIGQSLRRADVEVLLEDIDESSSWTAAQMGAGTPLNDEHAPATVVVAVPPRFAGAVMAKATQRFPNAAVTDVASVKTSVLAEARAAGADMSRIVGGHPMAGREVTGALGARVDLLDDRLWIITPEADTDADALMQVHRLITACGAYAVEMTPDEHDRAVALVSHTPQLLSSVLASQLLQAKDEHVRVAGQGLRDMTRIAGSDPELWVDILSANPQPVADALRQLIGGLEDALARIEAGTGIDQILEQGNAGRARVPGKHGATAEAYLVVPVMIADRPGELARLFTAAADANVSIEDVTIEHVLGRPSGLVELAVTPVAAEALRKALADGGFDVRI
jgi:prephenate dehydrogenase